MELLIDKKYLIRLENYAKFGYGGTYNGLEARYVFAPPERAGLPDGYTIYIDAEKVEYERDDEGHIPYKAKPLYTKELENGKTYRLDRPSNMVYVAQMTENREEGKRYKRYKYSAEELYALYQNVDLSTAELAVARVDIYLEGRAGNEHKALYGNRIGETRYLVGKVQGCWFYNTELDTKRRIGSHGVTVLGKIKPSDEPEAWNIIRAAEQQIKEYKKEVNNIFHARRNVEEASWAIRYYMDEKNLRDPCGVVPKDKEALKAIRAIYDSAESAKKLLDSKIAEEPATIKQLEAELEAQLKKFLCEV